MGDFYPYAIVKEADGKYRKQYTYQGCANAIDALECIKNWDKHYNMNIVLAWIDVQEDGKLDRQIPVKHEWVMHPEESVDPNFVITGEIHIKGGL